MKPNKPGFIRRLFTGIGKVFGFLRTLINVLLLVVFIAAVSSLFVERIRPLPDHAFLRVAPSGILVEQLSYIEPMARLVQKETEWDAETLSRDLIKAIDGASTDARITGIALELDHLDGGGISKLEDVGAALERFRASGKPIIAVGDSYTQEQYYLASFATEIYLNPMGAVLLTGYGSYHPFFAEAMDKLHIKFHVFRAGQYKDAIEPFTRNDMSAASREHTSAWINALWRAYTARVETARKLPPATIDRYIDNLDTQLAAVNGDAAKLALEQGLVDHIDTQPGMTAKLKELAGTDPESQDYLAVDFQDYLVHHRLKSKKNLGKGKVGVVVAAGTIVDGEAPDGTTGSETFTAVLREAGQDKELRALVLRIDSPGGSAFASDIIRREIEALQKRGIPVVVSMSSLAASGGYWIAAGADKIFATPTTLTGSIGVFGIIPTFENTLASLGVHSDGVGTTRLADLYRLDRPMSPQAERVIQHSVDNIYQQFTELVATARKLPLATVGDIAQGHVWTGAKAKELGLVDEIGGLPEAIAAAAQLAKLDSYEVENFDRPHSLEEILLDRIANGASRLGVSLYSSTPTGQLPDTLFKLIERVKLPGKLSDPRGFYLQCFECSVNN